jgi:hypothetical protein
MDVCGFACVRDRDMMNVGLLISGTNEMWSLRRFTLHVFVQTKRIS